MFESCHSRLAVISLFSLLSCTSTNGLKDVNRAARLPAQAPSTLTYESFVRLLKQYRPDSVEQTLSLLRQKYPDYLSFHTFVYQSFSLQGSSFQAPRALVFGRDSKLVMTFNGDKSEKGNDTIEVMHFDENKSEFEFREIQFPKDRTSLTEEELDPNAKFSISEKNGTAGKCLMCHGSPARPNWNNYPFWPGVYGSHDDFLGFGPAGTSDPSPDQSDYREWNEYKTFMSGARQTGRYAFLPKLSSDLNSDTFPRTNLRFNGQISLLNGERIARQVKLTPAFYKRRYAIISAILCENVEFGSYPGIPGALDRYNLTRDYNSEELFVQAHIEAKNKSETSRYQDLFHVEHLSRLSLRPLAADLVTTARLVKLVGRETVGNWSMSTGQDSFDFSLGQGANSFKPTLLPALIRELAPEYLKTVAYENGEYQTNRLDQQQNASLTPLCKELDQKDLLLNPK